MNLLLSATWLATEAAETAEPAAEGGGIGSTVAVALLVGALILFAIAYIVVGPGRTRGTRTRGDIPLAMRPYHSDEELETTGLERAMSWAVALAMFIAVFIPLYWVVEPSRIEEKKDEFYEEDVSLGRALYAANCTTCHGVNAEGGSAPHPSPEVDASWPAPPLNNIAARYEDSNVVTDVEYFVEQTIKQGRPGTPMPAWGSAFAGPMNDQQVEAIAKYILAIQTGELQEPDAQAFVGQSGEELFTNNCARCHGYDAQGRVGPNLRVIFDQFGADPSAEEVDQAALTEARESIQYILTNGLYVPTGATMPSFADDLTPDAMTKIIDYLQSIQIPLEEAGITAEVGQQGLVYPPNEEGIEADRNDPDEESAGDEATGTESEG